METVWTGEKIREAAAGLKRARPVYAEILEFYTNLCEAQENCRKAIRIEPVIISAEALAVKRKDFFPLVTLDQFIVDIPMARELLAKICQIAGKATGPLKNAAGRMASALEENTIDAPALFKAMTDGQDAPLRNAAETLDIPQELITFLIYNSIVPAVASGADQLATYLSEDTVWEKGYCPICGSVPSFAMFEQEGRRTLVCSFCRHHWSAPRLFCPYCENRENKTLHYFYSDEEKEYRVDVCDNCGKYIKTIDMREVARPVFPPLEQIATLHLDIKARELGHTSGSPVVL